MFPADRIRQLRLEKKLTQKELSHSLGIDRTTLTKYETGERKPDVATLYNLADFFEVSLEFLTGRASLSHAAQAPVALDELLDPASPARITLWGMKLRPEEKQQLSELLKTLHKKWNT